MIVDTSALVAILRDEPDAATFAHAIAEASDVRISAATYVESGQSSTGPGTRSPAGAWTSCSTWRQSHRASQ